MTYQQEIESLEKRMADLQGELSQISDKIAELKEPKKWPQEGDTYFLYYADGALDVDFWAGDEEDNSRLLVGNCFRTQQEAQDHVDYLKARKQLIDAIAEVNEGWVPDWNDFNDTKCQIYYNHWGGSIYMDGKGHSQYTPDCLCVRSYKAAEQVLSKLPHNIIKLAITGKK